MSIEERIHYPPTRQGNVLKLGFGQSLVVGTHSTRLLRLPLKLSFETTILNLGVLPKGLLFKGGIRRASCRLTFQLINTTLLPVHLGSKLQFCGVRIPIEVTVFVKHIDGRVSECRDSQTQVPVPRYVGLVLDHLLSEEFPEVCTDQLGCIRHYQPPPPSV